jgi:L-ascorbate metabolism protein UlaG (beta-lactamase superfamily)
MSLSLLPQLTPYESRRSRRLRDAALAIIGGLGIGEHFEYWGYEKAKIIEKDWQQEVSLGDGFIANIVPARHFSGRAFKRNQSLWVSFVLQTPTQKFFIGGDSGYDTHFAEIGKKDFHYNP